MVDSYYKPGILLRPRGRSSFIWDEDEKITIGQFKQGEVAIGLGYSGKYRIRILAPGGFLGTVRDIQVTLVEGAWEPD